MARMSDHRSIITGMGFTTPSYDLPDLFSRVDRGDLQLPDFQRSYAWDVDLIRALVVTVLRGYPIGCLMALDTRNEPMRFRPRPLVGAPDTGTNPGLLLLDGQQRLTTLYHCFRGDGTVDSVDFRSKKVRRTFYVDIRRAVSGKDVMPDEAVFSVEPSGEVRSHFGPKIPEGINSYEDALRNGCVPVARLLDGRATDLLFDLAATADEELAHAIKEFQRRIVAPLSGYTVPVIRIGRETAKSGVGSIFAQVNSAGLQMDVFELLTAVFAAEDEDFHLAQHWAETEAILRQYPVLDAVDRTRFLMAASLLVTGRRGRAAGQREDILNLSLHDYLEASEALRITFVEAAVFLNQRCFLKPEHVPYPAQLVPLAVILAMLADTPAALATTQGWDLLNRWFWSGVFGELYGSPAVTIRAAHDVDQVSAWIRGESDEVPKTVADASFTESRLLSIGENSGVYKGIVSLLMARGARDWRTGQTFDQWSYDALEPVFQRIFPAHWLHEMGVDPILADSVLNRTPLGARTRVMMENNSPARYLPRIQSKSLLDDEEFDELLASHEITPKLLHSCDALAFFADRRERILGMVEYALDKEVIRDVDDSDLRGGDEGPSAFVE